MTLAVVPIDRTAARAFVFEHHRHNGAPVADMFRCALELGGEVVGVAIAGRPTAPELQDGFTLEVTRVCTLGTRNACSRLYGRIARAAAALGYRRLVTYTLEDEPGTSPAAAGFRDDGLTDPRLERDHRPRYAANLFGEETRPPGRKRRWIRDLA